MNSPALKSRFWCSKCYEVHLPNQGAVCKNCNSSMLEVEIIANRYIFNAQNRLGKGVVKVWDHRMRRWAAIKFPQGSKQYADDSQGSKFSRIDREMVIQAQLEHPAIVAAYDVVDDGDYGKGLVMSLVEGVSLYKLVSKRGPLRVRAAVEIIRDITEAVQYMHKRGIIHRDLTPGNIIIEGKKPVLIDFGLAKITGDVSLADPSVYLKPRNISGKDMDVTKKGEILGTPLFMAPEQVEGSSERIDFRSDVYGLGATLYYITAGKPPFSGKDILAVISQVLHRDPDPPSRLNYTIDPPLEAIILKAMRKEREKRFQTAEELYESLQKWLDGEDLPPTVYVTPRMVKFYRRVGHMRRVIVFLLLVLAILFTVGSYVYLQYTQSLYTKENFSKYRQLFQKEVENMGNNWVLEMAEEARKKGDSNRSLALVVLLKNRIQNSQDKDSDIWKKIKQYETELTAQENLKDRWSQAQDSFKKGKEQENLNPEVAFYFYLISFDLFKDLYLDSKKAEAMESMEKIYQRVEILEEKNLKQSFQFYLLISKTMETTYKDSTEGVVKKFMAQVTSKIRKLKEKIQ